MTSLARLGVDSGGTLTERTNDSILALNTALSRLSCVYSLGFRDDNFQESRRKSFSVSLRRKRLRAVQPAFYVLRTEEMKRESRLLAAFFDPTSSDNGSLRAFLIPRGGDGTTWKATVQLRLRPTGLPDNSAEMGASIVRHDSVVDHFASSIATKSGSRLMVLEKSLDIAPGEFSVVAVARDAKRDEVGSDRLDANWPNPITSAAAIAPIAVLQDGQAAMSRDGDIATSGSLARDVDEMLDPSTSISLTSVVCRGAKTNRPIIVERWLEDGSRDEFAPMTIVETGVPCLQTVDALRAGRLRPGVIDYRVVARVGDEIVAQERRTLRVGTKP